MKVSRSIRPAAELFEATAWESADAEDIALEPIPIEAQPNRYIRAKWQDRPYATVKSVAASACAAGDTLLVRLQWPDDATANGEFADAAAVVTGAGPAETLGDDAAETGLWYWAEDRQSAERFVSRGPGVFSRADAAGVSAAASLDDGVWRVVLSGPLADVIDDRIGIAVWNGSNEERAGLGAVSGWISLEKE
jgi:DMSO reductase family type II enzyme heme b subunit